MLKRLLVKNFTVFTEADFAFGPGLNVVVGTNGTGKSHVLKAGYAMLYATLEQVWESLDGTTAMEESLKDYQTASDKKLKDVFQPTPFQASELIRRANETGEALLSIELTTADGLANSTITITPQHSEGPVLRWAGAQEMSGHFTIPVFIPAKEVLTLSWLLTLYNMRQVPVDETYPDLLKLLAILPLKVVSPSTAQFLKELREIIGGRIEEEGGRYYLSAPNQRRMEVNLVAEGLRKFAILYKLLANGILTPQTTLFWDEPEANLNPALLKKLAAVLAALSRQGFQIILATHSLFLMKELHILSRQPAEAALPIRYFGLNARPGEATHVTTADDFENLPDIVALDVALEQGEEFLNTLNEPDANL